MQGNHSDINTGLQQTDLVAEHTNGSEDNSDNDLYQWQQVKGFVCARCGSNKYSILTESMVYQCHHCHHQSLDY